MEKKKEKNTEQGIFAGGCFWCLDKPYRHTEGVLNVETGYSGGALENPTYVQVSTGRTGHYEVVRVTYDPSVVTYSRLVDIFFQSIDPTDGSGQFADRGSQYKTAIFYLSEDQKKIAEEGKDYFDKAGIFDKPILTEILKASAFYIAEDYHQDYPEKYPEQYERYREGSGRGSYLRAKWQDGRE